MGVMDPERMIDGFKGSGVLMDDVIFNVVGGVPAMLV